MYLRGQSLGDLGFAPLAAFEVAVGLKNLLGIGKKKRALKAIEGQAVGYWTDQLPSDIDWNEYANRRWKDANNRFHVQSYQEWYDVLHKRKDSHLIKNNVASPADFAAYSFLNDQLPNVEDWTNRREAGKVSDASWKKFQADVIPKRKDGSYLDQLSAAEKAAAANAKANAALAAKQAAAEAETARAAKDAALTAKVQAAFNPTPAAVQQSLLPGAYPLQFPISAGPSMAPATPATPTQPAWIMPAMIVAGAGALALVLARR